jgi:hypothetical protein
MWSIWDKEWIFIKLKITGRPGLKQIDVAAHNGMDKSAYSKI